jgi:hypothetical protein
MKKAPHTRISLIRLSHVNVTSTCVTSSSYSPSTLQVGLRCEAQVTLAGGDLLDLHSLPLIRGKQGAVHRQTLGKVVASSSGLMKGSTMQRSPCFQLAGVATFSYAVSWSESITRRISLRRSMGSKEQRKDKLKVAASGGGVEQRELQAFVRADDEDLSESQAR